MRTVQTRRPPLTVGRSDEGIPGQQCPGSQQQEAEVSRIHGCCDGRLAERLAARAAGGKGGRALAACPAPRRRPALPARCRPHPAFLRSYCLTLKPLPGGQPGRLRVPVRLPGAGALDRALAHTVSTHRDLWETRIQRRCPLQTGGSAHSRSMAAAEGLHIGKAPQLEASASGLVQGPDHARHPCHHAYQSVIPPRPPTAAAARCGKAVSARQGPCFEDAKADLTSLLTSHQSPGGCVDTSQSS